jgi:hypothetical protein
MLGPRHRERMDSPTGSFGSIDSIISRMFRTSTPLLASIQQLVGDSTNAIPQNGGLRGSFSLQIRRWRKFFIRLRETKADARFFGLGFNSLPGCVFLDLPEVDVCYEDFLIEKRADHLRDLLSFGVHSESLSPKDGCRPEEWHQHMLKKRGKRQHLGADVH